MTSTAAVGVNLFFEIISSQTTMQVVNTVGFNAAPELATFTIPVEFEPTPPGASIGRTMGLAIANRNATSASLSLTLLNDQGAAVATHPVTLGPLSQVAIDLRSVSEFAAVLPAGNFIGALVVTSSLPVSAIALEDDLGPFSAVPVMNGRP